MTSYEWTFSDAAARVQFVVVLDTATRQLVVESLRGSFDLNALWFSDGDGRAGEFGGAGADLFRYAAFADSPTLGAPDVITDFTPGVDRIQLLGLGSFAFIGAAGHTTAPVATVRAFTDSVNTFLSFDTADADVLTNMVIRLNGVVAIGAGDIVFG